MATAPAFNQSMKVFVQSLGPAASQQLAKAAHQGEDTILRQQSSRRSIMPGHIEAVDGVQGRPFESVKPDGIIVAIFDYRAEIVAACFEELRARSPVVSGRYRDSHFCQLDGKGMAPLQVPTAEQVKKVRKITITNPQPYSRKLEVGKTEAGEPFVKQVDPYIFENAADAVRHEFGNVAVIEFNYVDLEDAYTLKYDHFAFGRRSGGRAWKGHRAGDVIRYPCINIFEAA